MQSILYTKASDGTANASLMTVQTLRSPGASTILVNTVSGVAAGGFYASMGQPHTFTDPITSEVITIISDATAVDFAGHINAGQVIIDAIAPGYVDTRGSLVGDIVIIRPVTEWANNIANILGAEHLDNGKHGAITANSVVLNSGQDLSISGFASNALINGGCMVAQRTAPSLSTTYQYGQVDRYAAKATGTAVTAGTVTQNSGTLVAATKGYEIKIAGATVTGTGIVFLRYRMEAKEALAFKNAAASISLKVYHDVGSSINATIFVNKANSADNFSATTAVANSGAIAVPNTTATLIKFENINSGSLGDVSNGLEIEVQLACGAVTTKNFSFGEIELNLGAKYQPFGLKQFAEELIRCKRYYLPVDSMFGKANSASTGELYGATQVTLFRTPLAADFIMITTGTNAAELGTALRNFTAFSPVAATCSPNAIGLTLSGATGMTTNALLGANAGYFFVNVEL